MIATLITVITGILEILDQLFATELGSTYAEVIEIFLAAVTPLLVWLLPHFAWRTRWPGHGA